MTPTRRVDALSQLVRAATNSDVPTPYHTYITVNMAEAAITQGSIQ